MSREADPDAFAKLFAQHNRWLHAYLLAMLADYAGAEEVFQEVCVVLWRKFDQFDPDTDFRRWAGAVARNKVYQYRDKQARQARCLSNEVLELVAQEALEQSDVLEERRLALHGCLSKLGERDRELISACYSDTTRSFQNVALQLDRPINTVYKALQRIRSSLRLCIERTMTANR